MSAAPQELALAPGHVVTLRLPRGALLAVQDGLLALTLPLESLDGVLMPQHRLLPAGSVLVLERHGLLQLEARQAAATCTVVGAHAEPPRSRWAHAVAAWQGRWRRPAGREKECTSAAPS